MKTNIAQSISQKLQTYTQESKLYPIGTLEDFCNKENILLSELHQLASISDDVNDTILRFKQKQKALIMQLLTIKGNITLSDKTTGNQQTVTLDKKGIYILAKKLGIG